MLWCFKKLKCHSILILEKRIEHKADLK